MHQSINAAEAETHALSNLLKEKLNTIKELLPSYYNDTDLSLLTPYSLSIYTANAHTEGSLRGENLEERR